jgi:Flp pilus assembly protein TadG
MKRNLLKSDSGAAAIEAAFILPFLCILYFGMQDLTSLITFTRKLTSVAATISDSVAQYPNTVTSAQIGDIANSIGLLMQPTPAANVHVDIYDFYLSGATVKQRWKSSSSGGTACPAPPTSNLPNLMTAGNDVVLAVSCMTYTPWIATFLGQTLIGATSFTLSETITSRPRASLTLTCTNAGGGQTCA